MKRFLAGLALLLAAAGALAEADWVLVHDGTPVFPGAPLRVQVLATNAGDRVETVVFPAVLPARLRLGGGSRELELRSAETGEQRVDLPPRGYARRLYSAVLPPDAAGVIRIELASGGNPLTLVAETQSSLQAQAAEPAAAVPSVPAQTRTQMHPDPEPALSAYEPMYFIYGTRSENSAKFQISFKYQLFDPNSVVGDWVPGVSNLYLGYTQTSLWDLGGESRPFRDTSYRPSVFFLKDDLWRRADGAASIGLRAGFEHESNGRDEDVSRSINIAYVRPEWRYVLRDAHYITVAPRLLTYLDREDNPDIARYRGHLDLTLRYGRIDGWQWTAFLRRGSAHGSVQLDAAYPLRRPLFANVGGYLHLQWFNGYGESLLDYNVKRRSQFRIGFSIVR